MKIEQSARNHQTQYSEQQRKLLGIHYAIFRLNNLNPLCQP